jgi:hypothetical protein|tara:strand:+ start:259 stop:930 length:672 start_codon:yes stop_codon:yes gene_type:complete
MATKKFEQFITELKYQTYAKAAKILKEKGHTKRADSLVKHNSIHRLKLDMFENYEDLRPFEMWVHVLDQDEMPDNKERLKKVTVYLSTFSWLPSEDNGCETVDLQPIFLYNRKEPYMDTSNFNLFKDEKDHRKSCSDCLTGEYSANISYYENKVVDIFSFEGGADYYRFTNRRDAVRFKKIITSDPHFIDCVVDAVGKCEELDAFSIHKQFIDAIKINDLYLD